MFTAPLFALQGYKTSQSYRKALSLAYVRYSDMAELSSDQKTRKRLVENVTLL